VHSIGRKNVTWKLSADKRKQMGISKCTSKNRSSKCLVQLCWNCYKSLLGFSFDPWEVYL
jgi:hypothetical protein